MGKTYECTFKPGMVSFAIRSGPGTNYPIIGYVLQKNTNTFVLDAENGKPNSWYPLLSPGGGGWVCRMDQYITVKTVGAEDPKPAASPKPENKNDAGFKYSEGLDKNITDVLINNGKDKDKFKTMANRRLMFGSPFQFTKETDFRPIKEYDIGRTFMDNILVESPVVNFIPGKPSYLAGASSSEKTAFETYINSRDSENSSFKKAIFDEELRYFGFAVDYAEYMRYVNLLCRMCALYLGIDKRTVPGTGITYGKFDWTYYMRDRSSSKGTKKNIFDEIKSTASDVVDDLVGNHRFVSFYVDASASFTEGLSNSTTGSSVAGMFDQAEGLMKDIQFLTSSDGKSLIGEDGAVSNIGSSLTSAMKKLTDWNNDQNRTMTKLIGSAEQIIQGSNVILPEIWGDSAYNKSYDFSVNLMTPYGDVESIYLNIFVPMMHIIALGAPRQYSANGFTSPFLVKVFAKGWFSCEMGIVDSISIKKAPNMDAWNVEGLPTEVTVDFSVRDLYQNLMITPSNKANLFFTNTGLMEYLAVTCGIDTTYPSLILKINTYISTFFNSILEIPENLYKSIIDDLRNAVEGFLKIGG